VKQGDFTFHEGELIPNRSVLDSIGFINRKTLLGSCRGASAANPLSTWLKQGPKAVSRHDLELDMAVVIPSSA
jgi:hypothetical protein